MNKSCDKWCIFNPIYHGLLIIHIKYYGDKMDKPLEIIKKINYFMEEVIIENNIKYLGNNTNDILNVYDANFCGIMLEFFPGSTIMMRKDLRKCAIMINGIVYNSYGICDSKDYFVAGNEEIINIQRGFSQLSDDVIGLLLDKISNVKSKKSSVYLLRKNRKNLT